MEAEPDLGNPVARDYLAQLQTRASAKPVRDFAQDIERKLRTLAPSSGRDVLLSAVGSFNGTVPGLPDQDRGLLQHRSATS